MVRVHPDPPSHQAWHGELAMRRDFGGVAQLGEHLLCKQGVIGSIPFTSTIAFRQVSKSVTALTLNSNRKPLACARCVRRLPVRAFERSAVL